MEISLEWGAPRICTGAYFIFKFADDTKLFRKTKEIGDKKKLQDDIDKLVRWSEKWQMLFNFGKCKCLHTGPGNTSMNYEMGGTILSKSVKEKYLGVSMNANMKVSEQCRIAASKGNQVLGMIRRNLYNNSVLTCRQHIINSSASAPPNATKIAVKKVSDVDVCMFGPEL